MADALFSFALEKLTEVVRPQLSLFPDATSELRKLSTKFHSIQAVLDDAESRQVTDKNVKLWLSRLRHVAYDIEDLVEDWRISSLGDQEENEDDGNRRKKARLSFGFAYRLWDDAVYRRKVAHDIKEIREKLEEIDDDKNKYDFSRSTQVGDQRKLVQSRLLTTSLMDKSEMIIAREHDKELMISRLVSGSSHEDGEQAHVVAILGIGGVGKTALARKIYHDGRVQGHYNRDLYWVCVSEVFDVIRLTKAILEQVRLAEANREQVKGTINFPSEPDALQKELLEALRGKRFLLVLDDVWNDDAEKWEMLRLSLKSDAHGSRILVTTRSQKVANAMNAAFIHELKGLSDHDSWELFKSRAFSGWKVEEVLEFENVGKKIVNKCKGVPLSIKVIGSAMNSKRTVDDWEKILESKTWSLPQVTDKILPPLLLTYCNLPTHLKPCFVYCSMFPKDWEFEKDMLVKLWVAQGFIQVEGNRETEDIGEEYFDDLVARSMFQQVEKYGEIKYTMHDLLHDLAEFVTMGEIYCSEDGKSEESSSSSNVRHAFLSFVGSYDKPRNIPIASGRAKKLRTLWLRGTIDGGFDSVIDDLFHQARFLRALYLPSSTRLPKSILKLKQLRYLHLPYSKIVELPDAIGRMKQLKYLHLPYSKIVQLPDAIGKLEQLRYLDLSYNSNLVELPESVSDLRNLHTLNLRYCQKLEKLPRGIGGMVSLRYLDLSQNSDIVELPETVVDLRNLHTLNLSDCRKLEKLPRGIGGMVSLRHLDLSKNSNIVELPESVSDLRDLHTLNLSLCGKLKNLPRGIGGMVNLRYLALSFNPNLVELPESVSDLHNLHTLILSHRGKLEKLPRGIGGMVNLRYLDLSFNSNIVELPEPVNDLRNLHTLNISYCRKLAKIPGGIGGMVSLRNLDLSHNSNLVELPESVSDLRNLHILNLSDCEKLKKLPRGIGGMVSLRHLQIEETYSLKYLPKGLGRISGLRSLCKFIVGGGNEGEGCGIDELQPLNSLQGTLYVKHLERVSCREEAEKAELWNKECLGSLTLEMLGETEDDDDDAETGTIDSVLEGLRPHENLEKLKLKVFTGSKLPSWMDGMRCLRKLVLRVGPQLERVPHLPSLKEFDIWGLRNGILPNEGWKRLVALQELSVNFCTELKCLPEGLTQLPSLENLCISGCEELESLPEGLGQLKKLNSLEVGGSEVLTCLPNSLGQLESLESLDISFCKILESLPVSLGQLKKLKSLRIESLELLRCLPDSIGQLESLESLYVWSCKNLESLPVSLGQLKKLESLRIDSLELLRCVPDSIGQLESLESLDIRSCKKLESLPVSLGQLKKLRSLTIGNSEVLICLPDSVRQLESLKRLKIYDLKKLESLPQGLRHLSLLQTLEISNCPLLRERCKREGGVDWPNISHIPFIYIRDGC